MGEPHDPLVEKALAHARAAAARGGRDVERRAVPAGAPDVGWSPGLLRNLHELNTGVYELVGEVEVAIDARGRIHALDDPRHEPTGSDVHVNDGDAFTTVARLAEVDARAADLTTYLYRLPAGGKFIRVMTRPPRAPKRGEKEAPPPPVDRHEADLNASTGRVFRYRFEPAKPPEPEPAPPPPPAPAPQKGGRR